MNIHRLGYNKDTETFEEYHLRCLGFYRDEFTKEVKNFENLIKISRS